MLGVTRLAQALLQKQWTKQDVQELVGAFDSAHRGYAASDPVRLGGASGGVATALLAWALDTGLIDGALVCRTKILAPHRVRPEFYVATQPDELLPSQGSKYVQTRFVPEALRLMEAFSGKLAVAGLPCDLTLLRHKLQQDLRLARKVKLTIGLFCGHNSRPQLIDQIIGQLCPHSHSRLDFFRFRTGLWRGYLLARFDERHIVEKPSSFYNLYQNLYFFCQKKCLYCHDHFAYAADIALGDIWSYDLKHIPVKYNAIICRNPSATSRLAAAAEQGYIRMEPVRIETILDGQARGAPTHHNTSAKSRAGRRFGLKIPDKQQKPVAWQAFLAAWIILLNYSWSTHPLFSKMIFHIPRPLLKAYLLFFKGLESIK